MNLTKDQTIQLFESYIALTGVASLRFCPAEDKRLQGKKLGIVNGSSWVTLWSTYFGNKMLPGVKLINVENEATQLNFMQAHEKGEPCPPKENILKTCNYAKDLCELYMPDAIILTCSTMNRSFPYVKEALKDFKIPLIQIDEPMMEKAVTIGKNILIVATHGPTVDSTRLLLDETAERLGKKSSLHYFGSTIEDAFDKLGFGNVRGHNKCIENAILSAKKEHEIDCVVLAQLSMSIFKLEHPDAKSEFGVEVLTSGEEGFARVKEILLKQEESK